MKKILLCFATALTLSVSAAFACGGCYTDSCGCGGYNLGYVAPPPQPVYTPPPSYVVYVPRHRHPDSDDLIAHEQTQPFYACEECSY